MKRLIQKVGKSSTASTAIIASLSAIIAVTLVYSSVYVKEEPIEEVTATQETILTEVARVVEDIARNESFLEAEAENLDIYSEEFLHNHDISVLNHHEMISSFTYDETGDVIYPGYYGGSFINEDGILTIYVKDSTLSESDALDIFEQLFGTSNIIIEKSNFSHNELTEMMNTLNDFTRNNPDKEVTMNFKTYWLDDRNSRIVVELTVFNDDQIELFRNTVVDSPMITFVENTHSHSLEFQGGSVRNR